MVKQYDPVTDHDGAYAYMAEGGAFGGYVRVEDYEELVKQNDLLLKTNNQLESECESLERRVEYLEIRYT